MKCLPLRPGFACGKPGLKKVLVSVEEVLEAPVHCSSGIFMTNLFLFL